MHPRNWLTCRVKNIISDDNITFKKQVPLYPRYRLKHITKDINDDMSTINYVVIIDDFSDAETVKYTNNATVKTPKKSMVNKIKKRMKLLNEKSLTKIN